MILSLKETRLTTASPPHPVIVTIWCAIYSTEIFSPVFISGTATSVYLSMLSAESVLLVGCHASEFSLVSLRLCQTHSNNKEKVVSNQYPTLSEEGIS
jgi:hypothetical protein